MANSLSKIRAQVRAKNYANTQAHVDKMTKQGRKEPTDRASRTRMTLGTRGNPDAPFVSASELRRRAGQIKKRGK